MLSLPYFMLVVVALTSLTAGWLGVRRLGLPARALPRALRWTLECVGWVVVFTGANLLLAALAVLGARSLAGHFVSLYVLGDVTWLLLSLIQGLAWSCWRLTRTR